MRHSCIASATELSSWNRVIGARSMRRRLGFLGRKGCHAISGSVWHPAWNQELTHKNNPTFPCKKHHISASWSSSPALVASLPRSSQQRPHTTGSKSVYRSWNKMRMTAERRFDLVIWDAAQHLDLNFLLEDVLTCRLTFWAQRLLWSRTALNLKCRERPCTWLSSSFCWPEPVQE